MVPFHVATVVPFSVAISSQEQVQQEDKTKLGQLCRVAWPGLQLTKRSDLHCYFWPAAARLVKPGGYFGFLTSSSWMDVEYGFALQGWMLGHFRVVAIMESAAEPWFEDARVKTCVTILQRCDNERQRDDNTESPQTSVGRGGASSMPPQHRNSIAVSAPAE